MDAGDVLGHEPMGIVEEVGADGDRTSQPGDRVVIPFNISCGTASCATGPAVAVRDDAGPRARHGRGAVRLHEAVRPGARAARPSTCACRRRIRPDQGARGPARRPLRLPLRRAADRVAGRASTRTFPTAARVAVLGLGPIGDMCVPRSRMHRGATRDRRRPRAGAARAGPRAAASRCSTSRPTTTSARPVRELTDGRGPDAVIDAVGHGGARRAGRQARPGRSPAPAGRDRPRAADGEGGRRPARRAVLGDRRRAPRRHDLAQSACTAARPTRCR